LALLLTTILTGFAVGMPVTLITDSMASRFGNTLKGIGLGIMFGKILSENMLHFSGWKDKNAHEARAFLAIDPSVNIYQGK
jgi:H+/gluconate symporter-like permease